MFINCLIARRLSISTSEKKKKKKKPTVPIMTDKEELDDNASTPPASNHGDEDEDVDMDAYFASLDKEADAQFTDKTKHAQTDSISQSILARKEDENAREYLKQARDMLSKNMENYDCHLSVIDAILKLPSLHHSSLLNADLTDDSNNQIKSDINAFHNARSKMYKIFPIPTNLWLKWINFNIN